MQSKKEYKLILNSKIFLIPSNFYLLSDVSPDIFQQLCEKQQYEVKSNISESILIKFINNWVYGAFFEINTSTFTQYNLICKEFDRNNNLIQIFTNYEQKIENLMSLNHKLRLNLQLKKENFQHQSKSYFEIIQFLFKNNQIQSQSRFLEIKKELLNACLKNNVKFVDLLTRKEIQNENGLSFVINEKEKTAGLFLNKEIRGDVFVPEFITYNSQKYYVNVIFEDSFKYSKSIKSIQFSEHSKIQSIENNSFFASSLEEIHVPEQTIDIGNRAFSFCKQLKKVEFSKHSKLKAIGDHSFSSSTIDSIRIPQSVTKIDHHAFTECSHLKTVIFEINSNLSVIENNAFSYAPIERITIPSHVKEISENAFAKTNKLEFVEFSRDSELISIGNSAFNGSSIKKLSIPSSVVELKEGWCLGTTSLTDIEIYPTMKQNIIYYDDSFIIGKSDLKSDIYDILYFARRDIKTAVIPPFIKTISSFAFYECTKLKKIIFQNESSMQSIGKYAFFKCALRKIKIPRHLKKIAEHCFEGCNQLKIVEFPDDSELELIDQYSFSQTSFESIYIPSNVKRILIRSFLFCKKLKFVHFPSNSELQIIDKYAFYGSSINCIIIPSDVIEIGDRAFACCRNLQYVEISKNSKLKLMRRNAFAISSLDIIMTPMKLKIFNDSK